MSKDSGFLCPVPILHHSHVQMAHGGGGRLMHDLIESVFAQAFGNEWLAARHDGAVGTPPPGRLAMTTDSYVVSPLFFRGGDIGRLAICGTLNDLAMCGAAPYWLSAGFIIEEGCEIEILRRIAHSMAETARRAGVPIVTGDTKVVDRGRGDGVYINTAGIGVIVHDQVIGPASVRPGDAIILSGDIGRHGIAVLSERESLRFESPIESDCADLSPAVRSLMSAGIAIHCLRDLTRGGLGCALVEIAAGAGVSMTLDEVAIPVSQPVAAACEILGLDPLYIANEGRFIAILPESETERALAVLREDSNCSQAVVIGQVASGHAGLVTMTSRLGTSRVIDMPSGELLPRIC